MKDYEFTLKFSLPDLSDPPENHLEKLNTEGCDDALVGIGQNGRIALNFTRESTTAYDAISSALADVKRAIPGARLIEATPDFVGLTEVADLLGFTRQNMRKLMLAGGATFPTPVHEGNSAIWHLSAILDWLKARNKYEIEDTLIEIANTNRQFNVAKEAHDIDSTFQRSIWALIS